MRIWILTAVMMFIALPVLAQDFYKWTDKDGNVYYSDKPMAKNASRVDVSVDEPTTDSGKAQDVVEQPSDQPKGATSTQHKIIMYSASWCGVCKAAKKYFNENHIAYTDYDVETSQKGKNDYLKMHGTGVPIILVDGQRYDGFSASNFDRLLKGN